MKNSRVRLGVAGFVALAIAAGHLFVPEPADAAGGALFRVYRSWHGNQEEDQFGESYSDPFYAGYSSPNPGYTIGGGNTPRLAYPPATALLTAMGGFTIPKGVIHFGTNQPYDAYTFSCVAGTCDDGYPVSNYYYSYYNYKGFFKPDHTYGADASVTIRRTVSYPGTTPNNVFHTTQFNDNYAFGRVGSIKVVPGPNKFGGTMRYFWGLNARGYQFVTNGYPCCEVAYLHNWRTGVGPYGSPTGMLDITENSPQLVGGTYIGFEATRIHTYLTTGAGTPNDPGEYITRKTLGLWTTMPWTTGRLEVFQSGGGYISTAVQTGYDNRTENREMGTLSLVVPWLTHNYLTSFNPSEPVTSPFHNARVNKMLVNFMPEPSGILLLGAGILGLAGVYRLRRR
jgi:hypothetical protein